jgi:hypothetical protein
MSMQKNSLALVLFALLGACVGDDEAIGEDANDHAELSSELSSLPGCVGYTGSKATCGSWKTVVWSSAWYCQQYVYDEYRFANGYGTRTTNSTLVKGTCYSLLGIDSGSTCHTPKCQM